MKNTAWVFTLLLLVLPTLPTIAQSTHQVPARIPVDVFLDGDDGLTQRLGVALEAALQSAKRLRLAANGEIGHFAVRIPTNVRWKRIETSVKALYQVQFETNDGIVLEESSGECWEQGLRVCAAQILAKADIVFTSPPQPR